MTRPRVLALALVAAAAAGFGVSWASSTAGRAAPGGELQVVAGEDVWGSIAAQLGGPLVRVGSIVSGPAADPHDYEPTAADARAVADARLVIANGAGYDPWLSDLVAADPLRGRIDLTVAGLAGVAAGGNPHLWYSPPDVERAVAAIARAYERLDPSRRALFARRRARFERVALRPYRHAVAAIRARYAGVAVGASESLVAPLARALGLRLLTPPSFLRAVSEGGEPSAGDLATISRQIERHAIAVWIVNVQNVTPDVRRLTADAVRQGVPVVTVTETLSPAAATFESWQTAQLRTLAAALAEARR